MSGLSPLASNIIGKRLFKVYADVMEAAGGCVAGTDGPIGTNAQLGDTGCTIQIDFTRVRLAWNLLRQMSHEY